MDENGEPVNWQDDPNEPRYCLCNQVSYGEMVGCDNNDVSFFCLFVLLLYIPSQHLWLSGMVSSPNHTFSWASLNKRLNSTLCTYFHL